MAGYNVAVVGPGEAIGQELLKALSQRRFPISGLKLLSAPANFVEGRKYSFGNKEFSQHEITSRAFKDIDIAFFCGEAEIAQHFANAASENGGLMIDLSGAFRGDDKTLEIIPEINAAELKTLKKRRLVTSPSAATIQLLVPLNTLRNWTSIRRLIVHSYEPVSESGQTAVELFSSEVKTVLEGKQVVPHAYHHQIAFNLLPETDIFLDTGMTRSEWRIMREIKRLWRLPDLNLSVTCIRVPLINGMAQSVIVDLAKRVSPEELREVFGDTPGVRVADDPSVGLYPQPWQALNQDDIVVGRIREMDSNYNTIAFWSAMDNLRKGAAVNAVQIAEAAAELKVI